MKTGLLFGIVCALALHAGVLFFGGLMFHVPGAGQRAPREVELLSEKDEETKKDKTEEEKPQQAEAMQKEKPPDAAQIIHDLEQPALNNAPALEAASLSAIEAALAGQGSGGGDFAGGLSFSSGGRIGGTGKGGPEQDSDQSFSMSEIDQKPRVIFQAAPAYPSRMRSVEGVVTVIFIVDENGRVANPRVEKSTNPEFEKPALDAIRQWKFEAAVKGGQRVACKMRVPIRFQPR